MHWLKCVLNGKQANQQLWLRIQLAARKVTAPDE
jgi:hypothetical protein